MEKHACTECSYLYRPAFGEEGDAIPAGTLFEALPESFACLSCGAGKDAFFAVREIVNEPLDPDDLSEAETCHVPFFRVTENGLSVRLGSEETPHPDEGDHFIEWVGVFDEEGEVLEVRVRPDVSEPLFFEGFEDGDFSSVRSACTLHGVWRGLPDPTT